MIDFRDILLLFMLIGFMVVMLTRGIVIGGHKISCDEHKIILLKDSLYKCELVSTGSELTERGLDK